MYLELISFWFYVGSCIKLLFTILYVGVYYYLVIKYFAFICRYKIEYKQVDLATNTILIKLKKTYLFVIE